MALRINSTGFLPQIDDDWIVESVEDAGVTISNTRTQDRVLVAYDHIREFMTDPIRDTDGLKHGFLHLKVQLTLTGRGVSVEPVWK